MPPLLPTAATWFVLAVLLVSCALPGNVQPTVKIGLSAPFEGLYRDLGYQVLSAVRLAVHQRNESGGLAGRYLIEFVALNDLNLPQEAVLQAHEMREDPGVLAAIGGWLPETARLAAPEFGRMGIAFVSPSYDWELLGQRAAVVAGEGMAARTAGILRGPSPSDAGFAESFAHAYKALGGTVVADAAPGAGAWVDLPWNHEAPPEVLLVAADAPTAAGWIARARSAGFQGHIVGGPQLGSPIVVDIAQEASEGVVFVTQLGPPAGGSGFAEDYKELSGGVLPGPEAHWAYGTAVDLLDSLEAATEEDGTPTRPAVFRLANPGLQDPPEVSVFRISGDEVFGSYDP